MVLGTEHLRTARKRGDDGQRSAGEGGWRPHVRQRPRVRLAHLWRDGVRGGVLLGLQQRRAARRRDEDASHAAGLRGATRRLSRAVELGRSRDMWRSGRRLATLVMGALAGWSCGSTAPDVTPQVASVVVSPATSTLALNAQLPLQAE